MQELGLINSGKKADLRYTIIIPHYNLPDLLVRLLASIPSREDTQIIVVDDCSNKNTIEKLMYLRKKYPKVEFYFSSVNGGGGKARNIGLKYARGKYVIFADADDYFTDEFADILTSYQNSNEYDIIYFNNTSVDSETLQPSNRNSQLSSFFEIAEKYPNRGVMLFRYIFGEPWCKIIRREIIENNKIRFEETPIHNDTLFSYLVGHFSKYIRIDPRIGYCTTTRLNSVSKQQTDDNMVLRGRIFYEKMSFLKKNSIPVIDFLVFTPMIKAVKERNLSLIKRLLKELQKSKYSLVSFLKDYLLFRRNGTIVGEIREDRCRTQ